MLAETVWVLTLGWDGHCSVLAGGRKRRLSLSIFPVLKSLEDGSRPSANVLEHLFNSYHSHLKGPLWAVLLFWVSYSMLGPDLSCTPAEHLAKLGECLIATESFSSFWHSRRKAKNLHFVCVCCSPCS